MSKRQGLAAVATVFAVVLAGVSPVQAQALRPEVAKPLSAANELIKAGKAREALAKVREADAAGGKTAAEQNMIDRMKAAAAQRAGDNATAVQALESLYSRGESAAVAEQLAFAYSQMKDFGRANQWANKAVALGGGSAQLKQLQAYMQGASGDYNAIAREAQAAVTAAEQAGRRPDENDLLRLADAQSRTNNPNGQIATLEKLVLNHPKKEYWSALLGRLPRKSGWSDRLALDLARLRLASGTLAKTEEFMDMSMMALQSGLPAEGKAVAEKGFAAGLLGTGSDAERHKRLRDLAVKQEGEARAAIDKQATEAAAAKDGNALVQVGYALVTLGQADRGVGLIEQGIAKGGLKRPEDAKLRLGQALLQQGKNRAKALQVLRSVQGTDGVADVARLWTALAPTAN
ncbi:hypothetical protein BurJ1DRAFT_1593 [Burkholderiales bacterium JOSHI_001]|nr:hypothetical protein BurJ1DRAFT_1593 [Burkholderiales bacterium JOSHI_001]